MSEQGVSSRFPSSSSQEPWGPIFPEYLDSGNPFFPATTNKGVENTKNAVRDIELAGLRPGMPVPDLETFYPILYLYTQSGGRHLKTLNNTKIVSGCLGLLRRYMEDIEDSGYGLLSYSFGFYCFQAMIVGMRVGLMAQTSHKRVRDHEHSNDPHDTSQDLSHESSNPTILPGGQRMVYGSVGGFLDTDAEFLLEALWKDRDALTYIAAHYSTYGWGTLLLLLGRFAIWALESENNGCYEWGHLQALCFRYSLVASAVENICFRELCYYLHDLGCNTVKEWPSFLVDEDDGEDFLNAYISRLQPSPEQPPYPIELAELFIDFLPQDRMLEPAHMMPPLVEALTSRIWQECDCADPSTNPVLVDFCTMVFHTISKIIQIHPNNSSITALAYSNDIIELAGRLVMSPLRYGNELAHELSEKATAKSASKILARWNQLLQSLLTLASTLPPQIRAGVSGSRREWKKIWHSLSARSTDDLLEEIRGYLQECRLVWSTLGDALGHASSGTIKQGQQCAYPRCSNAAQDSGMVYICGMCLQTTYCSKRCQER
ncbi:hypothetical protein FRC12_012014 [Ceratobasidium sp. 428]|nr:hypothetical protein FRC12_012014 [Ceratobasidium sp. 428]